MEFLKLPGGAELPLLTTAEQASWESQNPVDRQLILNSDENTLYYWDNPNGVSIAIPIGSPSYGPFTVYVDVSDGATDYTDANLIGATVTKVFRQGLLYRVVTVAPANTLEIQFDDTTGTLTLYSGDAVEGGEVWAIEYTGIPSIS